MFKVLLIFIFIISFNLITQAEPLKSYIYCTTEKVIVGKDQLTCRDLFILPSGGEDCNFQFTDTGISKPFTQIGSKQVSSRSYKKYKAISETCYFSVNTGYEEFKDSMATPVGCSKSYKKVNYRLAFGGATPPYSLCVKSENSDELKPQKQNFRQK